MKEIYSCASFFAGVGGIELGFEKTRRFKVIYANEFDPNAIKTYELNFPIKVDGRDIHSVRGDEIPRADIFLAGFPCQAFSIAGYQEGFHDAKGRGKLFFELVRLIQSKPPKAIFLENVKNLVSHDNGKTFRIIVETLESLGYQTRYQVMNAKDYGNIPQNRERIYLVGFQNPKACEKFSFPNPIERKKELEDVIDFDREQEGRFYYSPKTCSFYKTLKKNIANPKAIYQWRRVYVRENKSNVCPTLTANMGTGGHNVPLILTKQGIRKLTPRECFRLQGFSDSFRLPEDTAVSNLYKQAGNSVVVSVIERIAERIASALDSSTDPDVIVEKKADQRLQNRV